MHRVHLLVVSENLSMSNVFRLILQQEGRSHVTTTQISEVDPIFVAHLRPDLVLVDVKRSTCERGWTVVQQLRRSSPTNDRPLVLCAPVLALVPEQECWLMQQGIALLWKPFGIEEVLQVVSQALAAHHPLSFPCGRWWQGLDLACDERSRGDGIASN